MAPSPFFRVFFQKNNALRLCDGQLHTLRDIIKKTRCTSFWTSGKRGTALLGVISHVLNSMVILRGASCVCAARGLFE